MTDTLIARLRDGNLFADRVEAADRIEYQDKLIEQFGGINKNIMEQCFALTKEVERLKSACDKFSEAELLASGAAPQQAEPKEQT